MVNNYFDPLQMCSKQFDQVPKDSYWKLDQCDILNVKSVLFKPLTLKELNIFKYATMRFFLFLLLPLEIRLFQMLMWVC